MQKKVSMNIRDKEENEKTIFTSTTKIINAKKKQLIFKIAIPVVGGIKKNV
jgi:hypothetical protein